MMQWTSKILDKCNLDWSWQQVGRWLKYKNNIKQSHQHHLDMYSNATSTIPRHMQTNMQTYSAQGTVGSINCMHQRFRGTIEDEANAHAWAPQHGQVGQISVLRLFVILSGKQSDKVQKVQVPTNQT